MASTDGLHFSQHGVWVLRDSVSRTKVPRSRKQKLPILLKAKVQTSTPYFCYILFINQSWNQPTFKNRRSKVYLSIGIVTKNLASSYSPISCPNVSPNSPKGILRSLSLLSLPKYIWLLFVSLFLPIKLSLRYLYPLGDPWNRLSGSAID